MEWKPIMSEGFVPDEPFVPDLNEKPRVQAVGLTMAIKVKKEKKKETYVSIRYVDNTLMFISV